MMACVLEHFLVHAEEILLAWGRARLMRNDAFRCAFNYTRLAQDSLLVFNPCNSPSRRPMCTLLTMVKMILKVWQDVEDIQSLSDGKK